MSQSYEAEPKSARSVIERALELLMEKDMEGFSSLWAIDGTMEFPFAPPNVPSRLEGRVDVADDLRDYPSRIDLHRYAALEIHECLDPDLVIVEMSVDGTVISTGLPYAISYVAVIRVKDGEITSYRDYWNPMAIGRVTGRLDLMVEATKALPISAS